MVIEFHCRCGQLIQVQPSPAGQVGACPQCQQSVTVPTTADVPDPGGPFADVEKCRLCGTSLTTTNRAYMRTDHLCSGCYRQGQDIATQFAALPWKGRTLIVVGAINLFFAVNLFILAMLFDRSPLYVVFICASLLSLVVGVSATLGGRKKLLDERKEQKLREIVARRVSQGKQP